jgi:hypothetical protein
MRSLKNNPINGSGGQLSSSLHADERSELLDSIRWLGRHIGESVFSFLLEETQSEGAQFMEQLDKSMSTLGDITLEEIISGQTPKKLGMVEKMQSKLLHAISSVHFNTDDSSTSSEDYLPPASKHHSALLFVDISGFTKLCTSLNVELLSKVCKPVVSVFTYAQDY